jgi:hypothetical protein
MIGEHAWPGVIISVALFALLFGAIIVFIWQGFGVWRAKLVSKEAMARDDAYRTLAEQSAAAQEKTVEKLSELEAGLAELRGRVSEIERLLREVG